MINSIHFLKNKAKSLEDIYKNAEYIFVDKVIIEKDDFKLLDNFAKKIINDFLKIIEKYNDLNKEILEKNLKELILIHKTNFKGVGQPMRIALTGSKFGPGIYDIILSLGRDEVIKRLGKIGN